MISLQRKTNEIERQYDFVVVGGESIPLDILYLPTCCLQSREAGPAGCTIASRLARSAKRPSVLLIEGGSENADKGLRVDGERFTTLANADLNWDYQTVPQEHVKGRNIDYSRGKGLSGR